MRELIRETVLGHTIRLLGGKAGHRLLPYPEEEPNVSVPADWPPAPPVDEAEGTTEAGEDVNAEAASTVVGGRQQDEEAQEVKAAKEVKKAQAGSDVKVVGWYSDTDPSNPQNWSDTKKAVVMFPLCLLTFGVSLVARTSVARPSGCRLTGRFGGVRRFTCAAQSSPQDFPLSCATSTSPRKKRL